MKKILRFIIAGLVATAVNLTVTYLLTDEVGLWYIYSSIGGFCSGFFVSFALQKFWTFRHKGTERMHIEAVQFLLVALFGLGFDAGAVYAMVEYALAHYLLAQFLASIVIAAMNFLLYHLIFRGSGSSLKTLWREEMGDWERGLTIAGGISLLVVAIKFLGLDLPYYQDEWKTARFVVDPIGMAGLFHHPPLTELLYRLAHFVLPPELLRLIPLTFAAASFGLLYLIVERRAGFKTALLAIIFLGASAYGSVAALMLDLDGAILPFFMLLAVYAYDRAWEHKGRLRLFFLALLLTALILGFLIKLSFIIVVGALIADYLYEKRRDISLRDILRLGGLLALFLALAALLVVCARFLYPSFNVSDMVRHALTYVGGFHRGWGQIAFQSAKALIYTGPILAALLFLRGEMVEKTRIFLIYLALGLIFYLVLFDFSQGALDKYLMFTIIPICVVASSALAPILRRLSITGFVVLAAFAAALLTVNFLPHEVLPLYPKSAWAKEALTLHWNILLPFFGGSGPMGFYVSFLFIAVSFVVSAIFTLVAFFSTKLRSFAVAALFVLAVVYGAVFTEELFFGRINGSSSNVLAEAIHYIDTNNVESVITHNDIGAFELWQRGKYAGRFYAVPGFEEGHKELFASHQGHYLVVDVPRFNEESFYAKFFSTCSVMFATSSGAITANVYNCPHSDPFFTK